MQYERIEPFGERRGDWQAASICSILANLAMARTRSKKRFSPNDFLLQFTKERKEVTPQSEAQAKAENSKRMQIIARNFAGMANAMIRAEERKKAKAAARRSGPRRRK